MNDKRWYCSCELTAADDAGDHVLFRLTVDCDQVRPHGLTLGPGHAPAVFVEDHQITVVVVVLPARETNRVSWTCNRQQKMSHKTKYIPHNQENMLNYF